MSRRRFSQKLFSIILTAMLVMQNFSGSLVVQSALASDSGIENTVEEESVSADEEEITSSSVDKENIESAADELPSEETEEETITKEPQAPEETTEEESTAPAASAEEEELSTEAAEASSEELIEETVTEEQSAQESDPTESVETEEMPESESFGESTAEEVPDSEETEEYSDPAEAGIMLMNLDEDAQTNAVFPSGNYNLEYILNRFNAVSFGDVLMNIHCMGSVLIQGNFSGAGSGFGDSEQISAPSYIGGYVSYAGPHASRHNASGIDLYVGTANTVTNGNKDLNGMSDFNKSGLIYETDNYVDWTKLKNNIQATSNSLPKYSTETINVEYSWQTVKINAGSNVTLQTNGLMARVELVGTSELATVINILETNVGPFPIIANLSASEDGDNMPLVWNLPNAVTVRIGSESTP